MANIKSQIKRIETNRKAEARNKAVRTELKSAVRAVREANARDRKSVV
jgi:small subunit ribosomal protein S20